MSSSPHHDLLDVQDLTVRFSVGRGWFKPGKTVHAVEQVSLRIAEGESVGLVGESGSGKSTTARGILQLVRPLAGTVRFEGHDVVTGRSATIEALRRRAQMIFQDPYGSLNQRLKVDAIVREPLEIHDIGDKRSRRGRVHELLDQVGLSAGAAKKYPHEFSGGQRQRIGIARALATEPSLVICDEPVAALDVSIQAQVLQLLADLQEQRRMAYLFISHDLNVVRRFCHRAAVMYLGGIVEQGPTTTLFTQPRHPYTQALVSAIRIPDPELDRSRQRVVLRGEIPSPTDPPTGCRFHTRCLYAQPLCTTSEPVLTDIGDGVAVACHFWQDLTPTAVQVAPPTIGAAPPTP